MKKFGGPGRKKQRCIKRKCRLQSNTVKKHGKLKMSQNSVDVQDVSKQLAPQRVTVFLSQQERTTIPIQPDGNCFFRALSTVLYGHQEKHQELRNHLVHFISSHKEMFRKFMFSELPLEGHLKRLANHGTWATHLEINAAACFLQIPIYVCTQRTETLIYYWELYNPLFTELARYLTQVAQYKKLATEFKSFMLHLVFKCHFACLDGSWVRGLRATWSGKLSDNHTAGVYAYYKTGKKEIVGIYVNQAVVQRISRTSPGVDLNSQRRPGFVPLQDRTIVCWFSVAGGPAGVWCEQTVAN